MRTLNGRRYYSNEYTSNRRCRRYIGSHTCVELLSTGHSVIVADNLINSKIETIDKIKQITNKEVTFYEIDVTDAPAVESIFSNHKIDGVIHFAGLKAVGESVQKPLEYYYNNIVSTMVLSKACIKYNMNKFVFSSSAMKFQKILELKIFICQQHYQIQIYQKISLLALMLQVILLWQVIQKDFTIN